MNIQEAINSGKRFKRPQMLKWIEVRGRDLKFVPGDYPATLSAEDVLASDWETEKVKKELTADDVYQAVRRVNEGPVRGFHATIYPSAAQELVEELGL